MNTDIRGSLQQLAQVAATLPYQTSGINMQGSKGHPGHKRVASEDLTRGYAGGHYPRYPVNVGQGHFSGVSTII